MSYISNLFRKRREKLKLSVREVAKRAGYTPGNLENGINKYDGLEDSGCYFPRRSVRRRFAPVLNLTAEDMRRAMNRDIRALDNAVEPRCILIRWMPAVHGSVQLPRSCSRQDAEKTVRRVARRKNRRCCLVLSRIRGLYVEPHGTEREAYGLPATSLGTHLEEQMPSNTHPGLQRAVVRYLENELTEPGTRQPDHDSQCEERPSASHVFCRPFAHRENDHAR